MLNTEVVRDAPRQNIAPIDESVLVPASVKRAAAAADAIHAQAYKDPNAIVQPDPAVVVPPAEGDNGVVPVAADGAVITGPVPEPAPVVQDPPITHGGQQDPNDQSWQHRFLSMQGRWQASQRTIGDMQEQMTQLGDELVRTQQLIRAGARPATPAAVTPPPATNLLTPQDQETYGPELLDLVARGAKAAIAPELSRLEQENQSLKKTVQGSRMNEALAQLRQQVPNWQEINRLPAWNNWLRQRDVYSGKVRHVLLNEANAAADAPRMTAFFRSFLAEAEATGQPVPVPQPAAGVVPPARVAAVPLVTLAAPGRARPAGGDVPVPAEKPVLTRGQVAGFYANVRAGHYNGREAEKAKDEAIIFLAQKENRIR